MDPGVWLGLENDQTLEMAMWPVLLYKMLGDVTSCEYNYMQHVKIVMCTCIHQSYHLYAQLNTVTAIAVILSTVSHINCTHFSVLLLAAVNTPQQMRQQQQQQQVTNRARMLTAYIIIRITKENM